LRHWDKDGNLLESVSTSNTLGYAGPIVWAGNVPEPATGSIAFLCFISFGALWRVRK
jgi:hypothetical protein